MIAVSAAGNAYYFTGGGSVLTALDQGTPYQMKPVEVLMQGGSE